MTAFSENKPVPLVPEKSIDVSTSDVAALDWEGDLLGIGVFEDDIPAEGAELQGVLGALDATGAISNLIQTLEFKGKQGSSQAVWLGGKQKQAVLVGLGKASDAGVDAKWGQSVYQVFGSGVAAAAKAAKAKTVALTFAADPKHDLAEVAGKVANGLLVGIYEPTRFKSSDASPKLETATLLFSGEPGATASALAKARGYADGVTLTKFLVEAPPNVCHPTHVAEAAKLIADSAPERFELKVLEREDCEKAGMGLYLGVAAGSDQPPKFIHLKYTGAGEIKRRVGLVGKGVTFDSGGYNIKAGAGSMIEVMKIDMGGAAAVLGAARTLAALQPEGIEVHIAIAATENLVSGRAYKPGDILVASNGKTVEIMNTDAEGRLTLADALVYVQQQAELESVVDIATLTGACMIGLGMQIAGMYGSTDAAAEEFAAAAAATGEKVWRLPLEAAYFDQMKSPLADIRNLGSRAGGSISAALFLKEFVDTEKTAWVHVDAAGPCFNEKDATATGFGAQVLAEWVLRQAAK